MSTNLNQSSQALIERLHRTLNQHDLDAFVACFAPDYQSEQPIHPDRAFRGSEQVRKNWSTTFREIPDFQAEVLRMTVEGDIVWVEWHWYGTLMDGDRFDWQGVTIFGVQDNQIRWGRLYMGPIQAPGDGIDATVKSITHSST